MRGKVFSVYSSYNSPSGVYRGDIFQWSSFLCTFEDWGNTFLVCFFIGPSLSGGTTTDHGLAHIPNQALERVFRNPSGWDKHRKLSVCGAVTPNLISTDHH
jgi:hypothetical protein